jgi:hypothetical protein
MMATSKNLPPSPRGQNLVLVVLLGNHQALLGTLVWVENTLIQKRRLRLSSFHGMKVWEPIVKVVVDGIRFPALLVVAQQAAFHPWTETSIWVHRHTNHHHEIPPAVRIIMALILTLLLNRINNRRTTCRAATIVTGDMRHKDDTKVGVSMHRSLHQHLVLCNRCDPKGRKAVVGDHHRRHESIV